MVMLPLLLVAALSASPQTNDDALRRSAEILSHPELQVSPEEADAWKRRGSELDASDKASVEEITDISAALQRAVAPAAADALGVPEARSIVDAAPAPGEADPDFRLFVSQGMPPGELADAVELARKNPSVVLVFRGLAPNQKVLQLYLALHKIDRDPDSGAPTFQIDPPRFRADSVDTVPTLIRYEHGKAVARASGLLNPDWLEDEIRAGRTGDRGQHGPTFPIVEEDMEQVLIARARGLDWAALREKAMASAWSHVPTYELPRSTEARERELDPTATMQSDVIAKDGSVIAHAGDRVNPLQVQFFATRLIVIDATDDDQIAFAIAQRQEKADSMVLFTRLSAQPSWDAYRVLCDRLGAPAYVLTDSIRQRFGVERVPTVIEAQGLSYSIREPAMPPRETEKGAHDAHHS